MNFPSIFPVIIAAALAGVLAPASLPIGQSAEQAGQVQVHALETPTINDEAPATIDAPQPSPIWQNLATFKPPAAACNCDGLTEADVRRIVRDELSKFQTQYQTKPAAATSSGGSTGGTSNGSAGGSTATLYRWDRPAQSYSVQYRTTAAASSNCSGGQCRTGPLRRIFGR